MLMRFIGCVIEPKPEINQKMQDCCSMFFFPSTNMWLRRFDTCRLLQSALAVFVHTPTYFVCGKHFYWCERQTISILKDLANETILEFLHENCICLSVSASLFAQRVRTYVKWPSATTRKCVWASFIGKTVDGIDCLVALWPHAAKW